MKRSTAYRLLFAASLAIGLAGGLGPTSAGRLIGAGPDEDIDLSVFETRLRGIAEEYGVEFKPEGQAFSAATGDIFLVRLGLNTDCTQSGKTCVYVVFRNTEDESPVVTTCRPGNYDLSHHHRFNGMLIYAFEFSCDANSKFQVQMSPDSVFIISHQPKE